MNYKPNNVKLRKVIQSNNSPSITLSIFLFIMGATIAEEINPLQDDVTTTLVLLGFLIAINVGLFRYMGLNQAFQRTHHIQCWNIKEKSILYLYLFLIVFMVGKLIPYGGVLSLIYLIIVIFIGIRSLMEKLKKPYTLFPFLSLQKHTKLNQISMEEIDKMDGKEFEVFLSRLYDGMGYYTEVTTHNDYGIDAIIIKDKIKCGIQAKCYGENLTIGVAAVNEICGGSAYWKVQKKMVITNRYFTKPALITAKLNNVEMVFMAS